VKFSISQAERKLIRVSPKQHHDNDKGIGGLTPQGLHTSVLDAEQSEMANKFIDRIRSRHANLLNSKECLQDLLEDAEKNGISDPTEFLSRFYQFVRAADSYHSKAVNDSKVFDSYINTIEFQKGLAPKWTNIPTANSRKTVAQTKSFDSTSSIADSAFANLLDGGKKKRKKRKKRVVSASPSKRKS